MKYDPLRYTCCSCKKEFSGYGNDPSPVFEDEGLRCCDECNIKVVIPERILLFESDLKPTNT